MPKNQQDTTATTRTPRSRVTSASRTRAAKGGATAPRAETMPSPLSRRGRAAAAGSTAVAAGSTAVAEPVRRKGRRVADAPPEIAAIESPADGPAESAAGEEVVGSAPAATVESDTVASDDATSPEMAQAVPAETHASTEQPVPAGKEPAVAGTETPQEPEAAATVDAALDAVSPPSALLTSELSGPLRASVKVQALKGVLGMVVAGLPTRMTLPVLGHVLLAVEGDGHLRITATDLDTTVTRRIPAVLEGGGAVLVSGKKLNEIVKELPDPCSLSISLAGEEVVLVCDATRTRFRLPTLPMDEFPSPPRVRWDEDGFSVGAGVLIEMINRTSFAASTEESRPILNGCCGSCGPTG